MNLLIIKFLAAEYKYLLKFQTIIRINKNYLIELSFNIYFACGINH